MQASTRLLQVCTLLLTAGCVLSASVGVVRVPRVYNVLIRSDGALAPSEAVSADSGQPTATRTLQGDKSEAGDGEEDEEQDATVEKMREELPVLDPKGGAIQKGVNYTEVPLSRAYPLTRYTAPLLAPLSYLAPLHGGLILGPVPRLPSPIQPQQPQQLQQDPQLQPLEAPTLSQPFQLPPQDPALLQQQRALPSGAFEDAERDSVAVEAEDGAEYEE